MSVIKSIVLLCLIIFSSLFSYGKVDPDSLHNLIGQERKKGNLKRVVLLLDDLSDYYQDNIGDLIKSDSLLDVGLTLAVEIGFKEHEAELYNKKGVNSTIRGDLERGEYYFQKGLEMFLEQKNYRLAANLYENLGIALQRGSKFKESIELQLKALDIRRKYDYKERIPSNYLNIGTLYDKLGIVDKQKYYILQALKSAREFKSSAVQFVSIYNELGQVYYAEEKFDSCEFYYEKVIEDAKKIDWKIGIASGLGNLAGLYKDRGRYEKSLAMHFEAANLEKQGQNMTGLCMEYLYISEIYRLLKKGNDSEFWGMKSYHLADSLQLPDELSEAALNLSEVYKEKNDFEKAYRYFVKYKDVMDSLYSAEHKNFSEELEEKYQGKIKQQKIKILSAQNEINESKINFGIATILLLASGGFFSFQLQRKKGMMAKNDLEQKLLRSQMNPHFIFNALTAIQNFMHKNEARQAAGYLGRFSSLSRSVLTNSVKESISLEEEIAMLKDYLELEKLRMRGVFEYDLVYDEEEEPEFINIPPMMIQPFVENAVKHGFQKMQEGGKLQVVFSCHKHHVTVEVIDNGAGLKASLAAKKDTGHRSMAMDIFNRRRSLMQSRYKKALTFQTEELTDAGRNGTRIIINLPIIED